MTRESSAYLQSTIFVGDDSTTVDILRVTNLTETEARAIRDDWRERPQIDTKRIKALAPKAVIEIV